MKSKNILTIILGLYISFGVLPIAYADSETIIEFRSTEDPSVPPGTVCENAPFYDPTYLHYVLLRASLWSLQTRSNNGTVVNDTVQRIGIALACARITSLSPGARAPFYMEFNLDGLTLSGSGDCVVASNDIPSPGLILAGCTLTIPADSGQGVLGGMATSNSVFNPFSLPGFQTGSFWTVHLYLQPRNK